MYHKLPSITSAIDNRGRDWHNYSDVMENARCVIISMLSELEGFSQCFTGTGCTGDQVPASSQRECCVGTNGLSFTDNDGTCSACVGKY